MKRFQMILVAIAAYGIVALIGMAGRCDCEQTNDANSKHKAQIVPWVSPESMRMDVIFR